MLRALILAIAVWGCGPADPDAKVTLYVRNDGTIPVQGGFFVLDLRGPPGSIAVEPARIPLTFLAPGEPQGVGPFVFSVPAGSDPALVRYRLAYANNGGLANVIPFSLPLGVDHPNVAPASEITVSMDETRAQGGISWSYYRLADANNGVTSDEQAAITAYPYWQRAGSGGIAAKALIALPDQPVAY